jgi:hypothetical protein
MGAKADLIQTGDTAGRPENPQNGELRLNLDTEHFEAWVDGEAWRRLAWVPDYPQFASILYSDGAVLKGIDWCNNMTIAAGARVTIDTSYTCFAMGDVRIEEGAFVDGIGKGQVGCAPYSTRVNEGNLYAGGGEGVGAGMMHKGGDRYNPFVSMIGSSGSGGFIQGDEPDRICSNPRAGVSGATFIVRCRNNFWNYGTIDCTGTSQENGMKVDTHPGIRLSGCGGGSGGMVIVECTESIYNSSIKVKGGDGADAWTSQQPNVQAGGGGGGGWVILQSNFGRVVKGNVELDPGLSGLDLGPSPPNLGAGAGGGCGGRGAGRIKGGGMDPSGYPGRYAEYGSPIGEF